MRIIINKEETEAIIIMGKRRFKLTHDKGKVKELVAWYMMDRSPVQLSLFKETYERSIEDTQEIKLC